MLISFAALGLCLGIVFTIISLFVKGPRGILLREIAFAPMAALVAVGLVLWVGSLVSAVLRRA